MATYFYKNLDCFSIINKIIHEKYKNKTTIMNGETFPEIIGYCYGLNSLKNFKNLIFIEPLVPNPFNPDSLIEDIPNKLEEDVIYFEPLISDGHISLIIFANVFNIRINIILDMSRYHSRSEHLNSSIYPPNMIQYYIKYPNNPIQNYSSCCFWFYGEIGCLMNEKKYNTFESIFDNIKDNTISLYIDII